MQYFHSALDETPIVKFGRNETVLDLSAKGKSKTYTIKEFCSIKGKFIDPGFIHDVLLKDLQPSTLYYYSCGVPGVRITLALLRNFHIFSFYMLQLSKFVN